MCVMLRRQAAGAQPGWRSDERLRGIMRITP
jgi:hypothetical protein